VAGAFLVSAPFWYDDEFWRWKEVELPREVATMLPSGLPVFLYHGRADEVVPFDHVEMYAEVLPHATVRRLDGRNHQLNDDLTEVANDIDQLR
jgi:pimeloyl-ACP methyl ester carboxylesterase